MLPQLCQQGIVRLATKGSQTDFATPLMRISVSLYHRHRFPAQIISHCVWLYFRFALSFRDVEEMLAMRGIALSKYVRVAQKRHLVGTLWQLPDAIRFVDPAQTPRGTLR
ncbi:MAG: hypothetical protein QOH41_3245 [Blastocatellia bacterium]|jgi:putative transposase|nr:hypothetical protein [Blastocatellia bacterium]